MGCLGCDAVFGGDAVFLECDAAFLGCDAVFWGQCGVLGYDAEFWGATRHATSLQRPCG